MDDELKEIEGLLENVEAPVSNRGRIATFKKYVKLVLPHVALVVVVCLYAVIGAFVFLALESPNEDNLKRIGTANINASRWHIVTNLTNRRLSRAEWRAQLEQRLKDYNSLIFRSYKEEFVRAPDVVTHLRESSSDDYRIRTGRNRQYERGGKLWTTSSALFFAATTMATIGYGNIVPATSSGRIACVIFALFGAPLAIITIGDLGKFLSECTIWLYKRMKRLKRRVKRRLCGPGKDGDDESDASSRTTLDWDGFVMDKSQVPVLLVFAILLLYIAFGGVLFMFLENWHYMDAFYYSFISLTTIGFGDIVPENHNYIILMLVYLGVGLAVTTMCIDLVGIQYIQKIHYFGRKFRGTDLLHLLKRKRMIERRLAMGQGEEILQMYIQHIQQQVPEAVIMADPYVEEKPPSRNSIDWLIDDAIIRSVFKFDQAIQGKVPTPSIRSIRSWRPPSIYSNSSASARSMMYRRMQSRGGSFAESGPALSEHCSLSTDPSVYQREEYWENFRSPQPSLQSFLFEFPPDYAAIASAAKSSRRVRSCPATIFIPSCPPSPIGMACMEDWDSYIRMLDEYSRPYVRRTLSPPEVIISPEDDTIEEEEEFIDEEESEPLPEPEPEPITDPITPEPTLEQEPELPVFDDDDEEQVTEHGLSPLAESSSEDSESNAGFEIDLGAFELVDSGLSAETLLSAEDPVLFHHDMPVHSVHHDTVQTEAALENLMAAPQSMLSGAVPPAMVDDNYCFVVDGDKIRMGDIMGDDQWWRHTSRPTKYFYSEDLRKFHRVNCITAKGKVISAKLASPVLPPVSPSATAASVSSTPRSSMSGASSSRASRQSERQGDKVALSQVYKVIRFYSFWKTCTSFHRIVTMIDKASSDEYGSGGSYGSSSASSSTTPEFKKRLFVQYLWRNAKAIEKARVQKEFDPRRQRLLRFVSDPKMKRKAFASAAGTSVQQ